MRYWPARYSLRRRQGASITATTPGEFRFVRGCFVTAAILTFTSFLWLTHEYPLGLVKFTSAGVVGAIIAMALVVALDWVTRKQVTETGSLCIAGNAMIEPLDLDAIEEELIRRRDDNRTARLLCDAVRYRDAEIARLRAPPGLTQELRVKEIGGHAAMAAKDVVLVTYRNVDGVHVFTSDDVRGLYVAGRDLRQAYGEVAEALHQLMKFKGEDASYSPEMSADEFVTGTLPGAHCIGDQIKSGSHVGFLRHGIDAALVSERGDEE